MPVSCALSAGLHCDSRQNTLRKVFPQAGPSIKSQSSMSPSQATWGAGTCPPHFSVKGRWQPLPQLWGQTTDPGCMGPLPVPSWGSPAGQRPCPVTRGGPCSPNPPNTLRVSMAVPSFRSHIKSTLFLLLRARPANKTSLWDPRFCNTPSLEKHFNESLRLSSIGS